MPKIKKYIDKAIDFGNVVYEDSISAYAAQAAFFIMLSFIPLVMIILLIISFLPVSVNDFMNFTNDLLPDYIWPFVEPIAEELSHNSTGFMSVSIIAAIWSSAKGFLSLNYGLNRIYNIEGNKNYFYIAFRAVLFTLGFIAMIVLSLVLLVFGNSLSDKLSGMFPYVKEIFDKFLDAKALIMFLIYIVIFMVLYKVLPNKKVYLLHQLPGAVLCSCAWYAFSYFFSIYIKLNVNFSLIYGSLTTLILVMIWLYFCMYLFLLCAEINSFFDDTIRIKFERMAEKRLLKKMEKKEKM